VEHFLELDYGLSQAYKEPKGSNLKGRTLTDSRSWWEVTYDPIEWPEPHLVLWPDCSWMWIGIEQHFRQLFGSPSRTLYVYTDAGQSQIVGDGTTDLLVPNGYKMKCHICQVDLHPTLF